MNVLVACMTYSCFRTLLSMGAKRSYAVELIGDIAWKLYEKWGRLPRANSPVRRPKVDAVNNFTPTICWKR